MPVNTSMQALFSAMLLVGIVLAVVTAVVLWSGRRRKVLAQRRRNAEFAWRASEDKLQQIVTQLPIALFEYVNQPSPRFVSISPGVAKLLPSTDREILADANAFFMSIHSDDRSGLIWRDLANPTGDFEWIGRSQLPSTKPRWLQLRATTTVDTSGERIVRGVILDVTALKSAQLELRHLISHRESHIEQERARLSREVHDELGQVLTATRMQIDLLRAETPIPCAQSMEKRLSVISSLIGEAYRSVKNIATELRPSALNLGLATATEWLAERLLAPAGIHYTINFPEPSNPIDDTQSTALFRIIQESLNNIVKHSQARSVTIDFMGATTCNRLSITDDGKGFSPDRIDRRVHLGLLGMTERAQALGAQLNVESNVGHGCAITVEWPS